MLIIGIESHQLTPAEREFLKHPSVAGVILFSRNFTSKSQLSELCADIRASSPQPQLICVDQEGGRVQRFREGFSKLPCLERFGELARSDRASALSLAREHAFLMATEIIASGLDLSFAPVADLGRGNLAIGIDHEATVGPLAILAQHRERAEIDPDRQLPRRVARCCQHRVLRLADNVRRRTSPVPVQQPAHLGREQHRRPALGRLARPIDNRLRVGQRTDPAGHLE